MATACQDTSVAFERNVRRLDPINVFAPSRILWQTAKLFLMGFVPKALTVLRVRLSQYVVLRVLVCGGMLRPGPVEKLATASTVTLVRCALLAALMHNRVQRAFTVQDSLHLQKIPSEIARQLPSVESTLCLSRALRVRTSRCQRRILQRRASHAASWALTMKATIARKRTQVTRRFVQQAISVCKDVDVLSLAPPATTAR